MHASEIRNCDLCGGPLCPEGHVTFGKVQFQRFGLDRNALMDRVGLANLFHGKASARLIEAFAPSQDVAILIHEPADLLICDPCQIGDGDRRAMPVLVLAEIAHQRLEERKAAAHSRPIEDAANDDPNPE